MVALMRLVLKVVHVDMAICTPQAMEPTQQR
jgi:hypothetical protein